MVGRAVSLFFAWHSVILLQILPFIQKHTSSVASFRHCFFDFISPSFVHVWRYFAAGALEHYGLRKSHRPQQ